MPRRRTSLAALLCAAGSALALPAHGAAADPGPYVALGDSYTAAPLVPIPAGRPVGCLRSDHNYPSIVAAATGAARAHDVSCTSATTADLTAPQQMLGDANPPQFDALGDRTRLVTIGIGGNDVGLVGAGVRCVELGLFAPRGRACRAAYAKPGGGDRLADQIAATAPRIAAALQGIHDRSPRARVLIVGYPAVTPRDGKGCYPLVPVSDDDIAYLDAMLRRTNAMLAAQAAANDAEFVDTYSDSVGHDVCRPPGSRWFEGILPTSPALVLHPNSLGEASMARSTLAVLGEPRPAPVLSDLRPQRRRIRAGRPLELSYRLNRASTLTLTVRRARSGRRVGGRCAPARMSNRTRRRCRRYSRVLRTLRFDGDRGSNELTVSSRTIGRRAGLLRFEATASSGERERAGALRRAHVRITRRR